MKKTVLFLQALFILVTACHMEEMNYHNPDVKLFIKQLKTGSYKTEGPNGYVSVPDFEVSAIGELLNYADDMTVIPNFPAPPVSKHTLTGYKLGEGVLWTIETIRLGRWASLGCKLVYRDAINYDRAFFLSDEEIKEVAEIYRKWWEDYSQAIERLQEGKLSLWNIESLGYLAVDPLENSKYRWW